MKKLTIFTLLAAMLFGMGITTSAASADDAPALIYINKNFDNQETGDTPWGFREDGTSGSAVVEEVETGKAAVLYGDDAKQNSLIHPLQYAPVVNDIVLSFKFKANDNTYKYLQIGCDAVESRATYYLDIPKKYNLLTIDNDIKLNGKSVYSGVKANEWYDLDIRISVKDARASISVNGGDETSVSLTEMINICNFGFLAPRATGSTWHIDDVKLYESPTVMSDEDFNADWEEYKASGIMPPEKYETGRVYQHNKFMFQALYNKFVGYVGAKKFYKNNRFYTMPAKIKEENGVVTVPARTFAEAFGAEVGWEDNSVIITYGGRTLKAEVGSDIYYINGKPSKLYTPVTVENGIACMQLEVLTAFLKTSFTRDGNLLYFGDKPEVKWDLGPMTKNARGYTLTEEVEFKIENYLLYDFPTADTVLKTYNEYNPTNAHPRVIINDFDAIKNGAETDEQLKKILGTTKTKADNQIASGVVEYTFPDGYRSSFAQPLLDLGMSCGFTYNMCEEQKYKDFILENITAVSQFPDIGPGFFLGFGNTCAGIAYCYDWMYNYWSDAEREMIEKIMLEKVFPVVVDTFQNPAYTESSAWTYGAGNQPLIIANGIIGCALSMIDKYPELCSEIVSNTLVSIANSLTQFAPDGAWVEGVAYWQYTVDSLPLLINNVQAGFGTDFGIMNAPGMMKTAEFPLGMSGGGSTYALGDDSPMGAYHGWFMFQAKQTNNKALAKLRKQNLGGGSMIDVVNWVYDTDNVDASEVPDDTYFRKFETATMRTGRDTSDTSVVLHGSANNDGHGHTDVGTFQFEMLGERWATEVPKEDYNLVSYGAYTAQPTWNTYNGREYYRNKAEGHNTVIANLGGTKFDQVLTARGDIEKYYFGDTGSYAILNMTETNELYSCALRGVKLDKINNEIMVQDNFKATTPTEFWWFMHTQADVEISEDGKSAILSKNNKRIWAGIISDGGETFQLLDAKPLEGYVADRPPLETPNDGYKKLAINKKNSDTFNVTVAFKTLLSGQDEPDIKPVLTNMENWAFNVKKRAQLESVTVDGEALESFSASSYSYALNVMTEKSDVPKIEVTAEDGIETEVIESTTVPGVTSVVLRSDGEIAGAYNFVITPLNDTTKFINEKQIPIAGYEVTSEPQAENAAINLFDGNFETKFATDESGGAVTMDFGEVKNVHSVMMAFLNGAKRTENFKIEYSADGTNYTECYNGTNSGTTADPEEYETGGVQARYIRVSFYGNNAGSNWVSVTEMCAVEE